MDRQKIISLLRKIRMLPLAEKLRFRIDVSEYDKENEAFARSHPGMSWPPYPMLYDALGSVSYAAYYHGGLRTSAYLLERIDELLPDERLRVCEWGCGPARIVRHLATSRLAEGLELFATDSDSDTIAWCRKNIDGVDFRDHARSPSLPFEENELDFLFSVSVFTHLSENMHHAWLKELLRVVRPGGFVLLTVHGEHFKAKLGAGERRRYEAGQLVVRGGARLGSRLYSAFQSPAYMRQTLLEGLEIVRHDPVAVPDCLTQDVWVVKVPEVANEHVSHPPARRAGGVGGPSSVSKPSRFQTLGLSRDVCPVCGDVLSTEEREVVCEELARDWELTRHQRQQINLREGEACRSCRNSNRMRTFAQAFCELVNLRHGEDVQLFREVAAACNRHQLRVAEIGALGKLHTFLTAVDRLSYSEYRPLDRSVRREDLTALTYGDGVFDFVLHMEILEHVSDYRKGLDELGRVLRRDGVMLFTVPLLADRLTRTRARRRSDGTVEHLLPPSYHGIYKQQLDDHLVFHEFGRDLLSELCQRFRVEVYGTNDMTDLTMALFACRHHS